MLILKFGTIDCESVVKLSTSRLIAKSNLETGDTNNVVDCRKDSDSSVSCGSLYVGEFLNNVCQLLIILVLRVNILRIQINIQFIRLRCAKKKPMSVAIF